jgi:hypothetical protein
MPPVHIRGASLMTSQRDAIESTICFTASAMMDGIYDCFGGLVSETLDA